MAGVEGEPTPRVLNAQATRREQTVGGESPERQHLRSTDGPRPLGGTTEIVIPQLATSVEPNTLPVYCAQDDWWMQQKLDGHRLMLHFIDGQVHAFNRRGEPFGTNAADHIVRKLEGGAGNLDMYIDGELLDGVLWAFDFLSPLNVAMDAPYERRLNILEMVLGSCELNDVIRVLPTARTHSEKVALCKRLIEERCEGVMLKDRNASYKSGHRTRLVRKAKFVTTLDAVVLDVARKGKASLAVGVYDDGHMVDVGAVSVINEAVNAKVGDVVEVRYLYASLKDRRLVQPVFERIRRDKAADECLIDQLKYPTKEVLT